MEIEWIGTGSGLNPALGNTSFLVRNGTDRTLLVDCGFTVTPELIKSGRLKEVTDIVLTHQHADHIGGLEGLGFMNYFAYRKRGETRPSLHVGSKEFAKNLWENSLKGGMGKIMSEDNQPTVVTLYDYFKVYAGKQINIPDFPIVRLFPTLHVMDTENYGVAIGNDVWYSGDSAELPKTDAKLVFQDCQFFDGGIHASYDKLKRELSPEMKARTYLVHLGGGWDKKDAKSDGFAGFVMPGDKYGGNFSE